MSRQHMMSKYTTGLPSWSQFDNVEDTWSQFKTTTAAAAEKVVGRKRGSRKERWISDTTWKAIDERKEIKKQLSQGQPTT